MVNSRFPPAKFRDAQGSGEELDIPLSQESVGDEDNRQEIAKMIEKLYADNLEKKRAQREKKILEYTGHQLNYEASQNSNFSLEASAKVVQDALQEIERLYEAFLTGYAACEDRIRKKWGELHDAEIELLVDTTSDWRSLWPH
ncbi:hypothetical protein CVT26_014865 [Gymnopilus dilepis]|uniref:Uncharacterized protein n=1 Tax=Gymnopilus dilepis TaxID=231916 RepID=A0A409XX40_9AGAR|nr:hypothetical protein CVT26_014865 [Gymnopilus dilepis]